MPIFIGGGGEDRTPDLGVMNPADEKFLEGETGLQEASAGPVYEVFFSVKL